MGSGEAGRASALTSRERDQVRRWLERERDRVLRGADYDAAEADELLRRRGERDPCAYLSPAAAREDSALAGRADRVSGSMRALREIEEALRRLEEDPDRFGLCGRCGDPIPMERLEVVPGSGICGVCASGREG